MEIVSTSSPKRKESGLEILISRKAELKQQIEDQKAIITSKTQILLSPTSFTTILFRAITKGLTLVDGFVMGYKIFKSIRSIIRRFKQK